MIYKKIQCPFCGAVGKPAFVLTASDVELLSAQDRALIPDDMVLQKYIHSFNAFLPIEAHQLVLPNDSETENNDYLRRNKFRSFLCYEDPYYLVKFQGNSRPTHKITTVACTSCHQTLPPAYVSGKLTKFHTVHMVGLSGAAKTTTNVGLYDLVSRSGGGTYAVANYESDISSKYYQSIAAELKRGNAPNGTPFSDTAMNLVPPLFLSRGEKMVGLVDIPGEYLKQNSRIGSIDKDTILCLTVSLESDSFANDFSYLLQGITPYVKQCCRCVLNLTCCDILGEQAVKRFMLKEAASQAEYDELQFIRMATFDKRISDSVIRNAVGEFKNLTHGNALMTAGLGCRAKEGVLVGPYKPAFLRDLLFEMTR